MPGKFVITWETQDWVFTLMQALDLNVKPSKVFLHLQLPLSVLRNAALQFFWWSAVTAEFKVKKERTRQS